MKKSTSLKKAKTEEEPEQEAFSVFDKATDKLIINPKLGTARIEPKHFNATCSVFDMGLCPSYVVWMKENELLYRNAEEDKDKRFQFTRQKEDEKDFAEDFFFFETGKGFGQPNVNYNSYKLKVSVPLATNQRTRLVQFCFGSLSVYENKTTKAESLVLRQVEYLPKASEQLGIGVLKDIFTVEQAMSEIYRLLRHPLANTLSAHLQLYKKTIKNDWPVFEKGLDEVLLSVDSQKSLYFGDSKYPQNIVYRGEQTGDEQRASEFIHFNKVSSIITELKEWSAKVTADNKQGLDLWLVGFEVTGVAFSTKQVYLNTNLCYAQRMYSGLALFDMLDYIQKGIHVLMEFNKGAFSVENLSTLYHITPEDVFAEIKSNQTRTAHQFITDDNADDTIVMRVIPQTQYDDDNRDNVVSSNGKSKKHKRDN